MDGPTPSLIKGMDSTIREQVRIVVDELVPDFRNMIECMVNERIDQEVRAIRDGISRAPRPQQNSAPRPMHSKFGMEPYEYLLMPYLANLIKGNNEFSAILQKLVQDLYFHPEYKRNHIICIPPSSYKCVAVMKDGVWKNYDLANTLEKIIRRANDILQHYLIGSDPEDEVRFRSEITKKRYDLLKEFTDRIDNMEDLPEFRDKLLKDTEHTILTMQHLVHKTLFDTPQETSKT